ncbi:MULTISPECIES: IS3 family transposase [Bacillus cereus group]|uniref:IS3 family transposase n=1 Tax=Bacillus cereus group TaxID=86661 RepID=UPI00148228AE|nr:IS3 family transposase [Bacillus wiedmannii]
MNRKRNYSINACIKYLHHTLNHELVYQTKYKTMSKVRKSPFEHIVFFYNSKRINSAFDNHTTSEYKKIYSQLFVI